jgi:hypothetical protein
MASTTTRRAGRSPRSRRKPSRSSIPRRKIGSAEANSTARIITSGIVSTRPRAIGAAQDGGVRGCCRAAGRAAERSRAVPTMTDSRTQAPIIRITLKERRVTASPEKAATDAPVNAPAPARSSRPTKGSARRATPEASTSAVTGNQTSSGSGARPRRRTAQPTASTSSVISGTFSPGAGPSSTISPTTPTAKATSNRKRAAGRTSGRSMRATSSNEGSRAGRSGRSDLGRAGNRRG